MALWAPHAVQAHLRLITNIMVPYSLNSYSIMYLRRSKYIYLKSPTSWSHIPQIAIVPYTSAGPSTRTACAHLRRTQGASWALGLPSWGLRRLGQRDLGFGLGFISKDWGGRGLGLGGLVGFRCCCLPEGQLEAPEPRTAHKNGMCK